MTHGTALIVGAGKGLSASLARRLANEGFRVALVARDIAKLAALAKDTGAKPYQGDARDQAAIENIFDRVDRELGPLSVIFNAANLRGPIEELVPEKVWTPRTTAFAGFDGPGGGGRCSRRATFFHRRHRQCQSLAAIGAARCRIRVASAGASGARAGAKNIHVVHFVPMAVWPASQNRASPARRPMARSRCGGPGSRCIAKSLGVVVKSNSVVETFSDRQFLADSCPSIFPVV
jgi:hypothetical protein